MLSLLRTLSGRYLRLHGFRTMLVVASIALGVAALVATQTLNESIVQAARSAATPLRDAGNLMVTTDQGVEGGLAEELRRAQVPGVKAVVPLIFGHVAVVPLNNRRAILIGIESDDPRMLKTLADRYGLDLQFNFPLSWGRPAVVGALLAGDLPAGAADFEVRAAGKVQRLTRVSTVEAHGPAAALGGNVLILSLRNAAEIVGRNDRLTRIDLLLEDGADREQVRRIVTELLGDRAEVRSPEVNDQSIHKVMAGLELGFQLEGLCALVVGLLLVYNVMSVSVAERRHDIGILRSLGATRWQVARLFLSEAAALGLVGALGGVPLGLGLARLFLGPFRGILSDFFMPLDARQIELTPGTVILAVVAGVATAMLAALVPAVRAAREEPADAVRRVPRTTGLAARLGPALVSAVLILAGLACFTLRGWLPERRYGTYGAIMLTFLGALVATIFLAAIAARLLQPLVRRFGGVEERLAADNLSRAPGRTGLVIASLAAFVALMLQTAGVTLSSKEAVRSWVNRSISADLFVTANSPITASGQNLPMEEWLGERIAGMPEVARCVTVRYQQVEYRGERVFLTAVDPDFYRDGLIADPLPGLELLPFIKEPGTALISENFALLHDVAVGDQIELKGRYARVPLRVLGTLPDYSWPRGTIIMSRQNYLISFDDPLVDVFNVYVRSEEEQRQHRLLAAFGSAPQAPFPANLPWAALCQSPEPRSQEAVSETILRHWGADQALVVMTRAQLRDSILGMVDRLYGIGYVQYAVVGLVAAMGVITSLLISVLQRQRELGLLRAVGASRVQVLRSVLAEALLMGLIGAACGLIIGIPMEWYAVRVLLLEEAGYNFPVSVPWQAAGVVTGLAMLIATLAGLAPAVHAVRLRIAEAIAYE